MILAGGQGLVEPIGLVALHPGGMARVEQHQAQVVAKVEGVVAGVGKKAIKKGIEKGGFVAGPIAAVDLMIAKAGDDRYQPALGVDHGGGVIANKSDTRFNRSPVVIAKIATNHGEHRIVAGGDTVIVNASLANAAVASRDEGKGVRRLGRHGAEPVEGR